MTLCCGNLVTMATETYINSFVQGILTWDLIYLSVGTIGIPVMETVLPWQQRFTAINLLIKGILMYFGLGTLVLWDERKACFDLLLWKHSYY